MARVGEEPQLQPPSCERPQEGLADGLPPQEQPQLSLQEQPPDKLSPQSRAFLEEEEEVGVPRAGISCSAGPGPNPKVRGSSHLEPSLTDNEQLHEKSQPGAEPGGPCDVSTSAPASSSTCATTNASVHALADDPGANGDRRERPQLGPVEGPGQPRKLQQGPPVACQGDSEPSLGRDH